MHQQIPTHESDLHIRNETTVRDVVAFVEDRLCEPAIVGESIVFSFHSQGFDAHDLVNANLDNGIYVIPYQASGAWAFMNDILPHEVSTAPVLTYSKASGYSVYPNFGAAETDTAEVRSRLRDAVLDDGCLNPQARAMLGGELE